MIQTAACDEELDRVEENECYYQQSCKVLFIRRPADAEFKILPKVWAYFIDLSVT
jgi:hypothetical protein